MLGDVITAYHLRIRGMKGLRRSEKRKSAASGVAARCSQLRMRNSGWEWEGAEMLQKSFEPEQ